MRNQRPVIGIAFVTRLEMESEGLPVLKVCATNGKYLILEGEEIIEEALSEVLPYLSEAGEIFYVVRYLAVEEIERTQRRRRTRNVRGGE